MASSASPTITHHVSREGGVHKRSGSTHLRDTWPLKWSDLGLFAIAYVCITAVFVGVGKLIVNQLDGSVGAFDRRWAEHLASGRTPTMNNLSHWGTMMAETTTKVILTALAVTLMIAVWRRWEDALLVALALILEASIFLTVTLIVKRARPDVIRLDGSPVDSSFPSGHVAAAVVYGAFAIVVAHHVAKKWATWLAVAVVAAISLIVAWSRTYRGMHYISDVVAGAVLGLTSLAVTWWIMNRAVARKEAHDEAHDDQSVAAVEQFA
jgi:membrane-associated phospholipid phosphatase